MSVLNNIDDPVECPLCMEPLEMDDLNFFPCTCGYQICRFCWHRIRTDENGLCPACRKAYPENPADFKPLTQEELQRIKQEKRQKDMQRKQKVTENRKHLSNVRVVQKNLVFVVGLSARLADPEMLKKSEYFGKYGKMQKVVINHSTTYAGSQGPSASAYVTYQRAEDALRAIQAVNNIHVDGRVLKASLGTTKYCSHFMKNQACPKSDCMYLHELGDESASFTKEEMQQGKHQEFEKKLQDQYLGSNCVTEKLNFNLTGGVTGSASSGGCASMDGCLTNHSTHSNSVENSNKKSSHIRDGQGKDGNTRDSHSKDSPGSKNSVDHGIEEVKEGWPALSTKEQTNKRNRNQDKTSGSARQTPTEEPNSKRNKDKDRRNGKETGSCIHSKDGSGDEHAEPSNSEIFLSAPSSSSPESCASSTSTTPPPLSGQDTMPTTPPHPSSSPLPVNAIPRHRTDRESTNSPSETTPSSLSSCSEYSSSLPLTPQLPSLLESSVSTVPTSLFSDSSNSFFSRHSVKLEDERSRTDASLSETLQTERLLRPEFCRLSEQHMSFPSRPTFTCEQNIITTDWRTHSLPTAEEKSVFTSVADSCSNNNTLNTLLKYVTTSDINDLTVIDHKADDDDLGFDPFEETNKALAEDILLEQEQQQIQERNFLLRQQQLLQQKQQEHAQQQQQQQQQLQMQTGLKNMLDSFTSSQKELPQVRFPPPGFNGLNNLSFSSGGIPQSHLNKLVSPFIGGSGLTPSQTLVNSSGTHINGLIGSNRIGVPPGLAGNLSTNLVNGAHQSSLQNNVSGNLQGHHMTGPSLLVEGPISVNHPPPGLGMSKQTDAFIFKDLENGLNSIRNNMFPSVTSVSTMNAVNTLNSLASVNPQSGGLTSQNNPITNFFSLAQQQQRLQQQQQQHSQHHQFSQQQNLIHHLGPNLLASSNKGWSSRAAADLAALDPAIVSSGQLTDSRTDSPPHWLRSIEQLPNEVNPTAPWSSMLPFSLISGSLGGIHNTLGGNAVPQSSQRASMWPPTSPPPGFNSLSPLHHAKQREAHKIENL